MNVTLMPPTVKLVSVFFSRFIFKRKVQLKNNKKKRSWLPQFGVGEGTTELFILIILNLTSYEH